MQHSASAYGEGHNLDQITQVWNRILIARSRGSETGRMLVNFAFFFKYGVCLKVVNQHRIGALTN